MFSSDSRKAAVGGLFKASDKDTTDKSQGHTCEKPAPETVSLCKQHK